MIFTETALQGAFIIEATPLNDERGSFTRTFCKKEFLKNGIQGDFVQCNLSSNLKKGTLRGMHYQELPFEEGKVVHCFKGAIYDVIIDLRKSSPTFAQWIAVELSKDNRKSLYVPPGFAHGFLTLEDNTDVFYQMTEYYDAPSARGCRWNDPLFAIYWPLEFDPIISSKDSSYPNFNYEASFSYRCDRVSG